MNGLRAPSKDHIRKCINIKSKKTPDIQCKSNAINGDYCSKHWKHPCRFTIHTLYIQCTRQTHRAAIKIQRLWRYKKSFLTLFQQGPCISMRSGSTNQTELQSLEPISSIMNLYYFSIVGLGATLWTFDIRSLAQMISLGTFKLNPYTREVLSARVIQKVLKRIAWLRSRGYTILYPNDTDLSPEQLWRQKVLDACMRLESFGFHVSCEWFSEMTLQKHIEFYKTIYSLWNFRLGLTTEQQNAIVPPPTNLFTLRSEKKQHSHTWWEKMNLRLIETLITSSPDKEYQRLGATYCMIGFVQVNEEAREAFPWLCESINPMEL